MAFSDNVVYVDESGDPSLSSINPQYPVFVLACCVFSTDKYAHEVVAPLTEFKLRYFGHDQVVLHERDIRKRSGQFKFLGDRVVREKFLGDLDELVKKAPFTLTAGVIDKIQHKAQYFSPSNPYHLALTFCLERLQLHLEASPKTTYVVFEKRGEKEDEALELEFRRICDEDNALTSNDQLPFKAVFADKKTNSAGLHSNFQTWSPGR